MHTNNTTMTKEERSTTNQAFPISVSVVLSYHFSEDAADTPDVNWGGVGATAEQYLRCTVPQRHYLQCTTSLSLSLDSNQ